VSKPKLLIISGAKTLGGGEVYLKNLLPFLQDSFDITVLGPKFTKKLLGSKFKTRWLPLFPAVLDRLLRRTHQLKKLYYKLLFGLFIKSSDYDIVNIQWFDAELITAIGHSHLILTLHTGFVIPRQYDAYIKSVLGGVNKIICVSSQAKEQLILRGIPARKIEVIHNGVELTAYRLAADPGSYITWVGRVEQADKNPMLFVKIAQAAKTQGLGYKFRLVGDGRYLNSLRTYAAQNQVDNLEFAGFISNMQPIYKQASLLCITSTSEALPLNVLEAMACGVPVVSTNVGGLPEIINSPSAGILIDSFEPAEFLNRISALLADPEKYQAMRQAARKRVEANFDLRVCSKKTALAYQQTIEDKR